jgi:hypothetical protein
LYIIAPTTPSVLGLGRAYKFVLGTQKLISARKFVDQPGVKNTSVFEFERQQEKRS